MSLLTVILNYRTPTMTMQAVEAALRATEGINGQIVVVDNDSADGSFDKLSAQDWSETRVHVAQSGHNGGFGAGNNFGIRLGIGQQMARGQGVPEFVLILNSDAFVDQGAIAVLMQHMRAHPKCGFACSQLYEDGVEAVHSSFRFPTIAGEFEGAAKFGPISRLLKNSIVAPPIPTKTCQVDWAAGASMMMRTAMLRDIGLFDESYFLYFEETDLCLRGARAGWQTHYVVESRVLHVGSVSTGMRKWDRIPGFWLDSRLQYFLRNHGVVYAIGATLAHVAGGVLAWVRAALTGKKVTGPRRFLRDLVMHDFRILLRGRAAKAREVPEISRQEDTYV